MEINLNKIQQLLLLPIRDQRQLLVQQRLTQIILLYKESNRIILIMIVRFLQTSLYQQIFPCQTTQAKSLAIQRKI